MRVFIIIGLLSSFACHDTHMIEPDPEPIIPVDPVELGESTEAMIGPAGGSLEIGDFTLEIPAGALAEATMIRATATDPGVPDGFTAYTPVVRFEPEGTHFERPIRVTFPFEGDARIATLFWTREGGSEYVALDTQVTGSLATAEVDHFSQAFVGTACSGACCRRGTGDLDVLFMVDNSNSMSEEQAALADQLPRMVQALATGDVNGDGVQDFPAVASLQIGTVSSDMGTGGYLVPTCSESNFGDDGILRTEGNVAMAGCAPSYPAMQNYLAGDSAEAFAEDVSCVANLGTNGCGFEQQLDSLLKAVTPATDATSFVMGTVGHGDGVNAGFVRDGAVLALINLTDEDDCSAIDPDLFNPSSRRYSGDLNLRCFQFPEAVYPVERYSEGLASVKEDPSMLVYALIAGVPQSLEGESYATILAAPEMQETVDPTMPTRLAPSCSGSGIAFPPRRLVQTAQQLEARGAGTAVGSVCTDDFTGVVSRILEQVADRVAGRCAAP